MSDPIPPAGGPLGSWFDDKILDAGMPRPYLADAIDPQTGELISILGGPHPVDAAIAYAFQVKYRKGIALGRKGNNFASITKNTDTTPRALVLEAKRIMKPFEDLGWATTKRADASGILDTGFLVVDYQNNMTDQPQSIRVGI